MSAKLATGAVRDLRTLFELGRVGDWTDGQLLEHFRSGPGPAAEAAFESLVRRHGPMVLRVCRGVLNDEHDTQDAFQATFLVLVRGAGTVRDRTSLASWLYGVAYRVASRAKVDAARRRAHERRAATMITESQRHDASGGPLADPSALDEEIRRLPEKYRAAVVLCYLEGLTQEQAAEHLGWPSGTVRGRLFRAREMLRARLSRRGLVLPAGAVTAGLAPREAMAVPAGLLDATVRAAMLAAGHNASAGAVSATVVALAAGTARAMLFARLKLPVALLGLGLVTTSVAGLSAPPGPPRLAPVPKAIESPAPTPAPAPAPLPTAVASVPDRGPTAPETPAPKALRDTIKVANATDRDPLVRDTSALAPAPATRPPAVDTTPGRDPSALAFPLGTIVVDGDLGDWPRDIERHPIPKLFTDGAPDYGGLDGTNPSTGPDLSAAFSVGYDPEEQLIYLAVIVRDDQLVIGHASHLDTDACEVYIDGLRGERRIAIPPDPWWQRLDLSDAPVQQYIGIPGPGKIYGTPYTTNPILMAGDLKKTRTRMAYRREGDVTTYEWAVQPFDRYPDRPTRLEPGKRIGFDLAVVDKDAPAPSLLGRNRPRNNGPAWIYWGPRWTGVKLLNAGNLGELVFAGPR
jgi:RNA polymerase sigma factor (sigma-70 family)